MDRSEPGRLVVRGIIHCHSSLSYDCRTNLADLCAALQRDGFQFVALTEHTKGVTATAYAQYVEECRRASSDRFVVVPGLEVRCEEGAEMAGLGLPEIVADGAAKEVTARIRALGGYAIWVHPMKRSRWTGGFLDCDAVEVLNGKVDGTLVPDLRLLRRVRAARRRGERWHAIFGLDMHSLDQPRAVWVECQVSALTPEALLDAFHKGRFVSRVANATVSSTGEVPFRVYLKMLCWRGAYIGWNTLLAVLPRPVHALLVRASRPLVNRIKQNRT